jgi:beta-mannosidase
VVWEQRRRVGFKRVRWLPCEGAAPDALPWLCEVNGRTVFLQGVNWSPIRVAYPDTTVDEYRLRVGLYRDMGCNFLRVWGGAYLESEDFYDLCDEAGLLVWQEFPLSSSGIDNWPPERPEVIAELCRIAATYIQRRAHHVSLLMWCGGNELQSSGEGSKVGAGRPVSGDHPCLKALADVVAAEDPERRFLPTSAYGPRFNAAAAEFGQGVHHLIHGPWGIGDERSIEPWKEYWRGDDALFRAEVGMPGACDVELIQRYLPEAWWPPSNETWAHSSRWWLMWPRYSHLASLPPDEALARYVELTQAEQAEALSFAARCCKARFPRCGGFVIWHGHDCFPCPIGNALIDVEGHPKPVCFALREVFRGPQGDPDR